MMTMRATVSRNDTSTSNTWGTPAAPVFVEVAGQVPCRVWSKHDDYVTDSGKAGHVEMIRATFPVDADVQEGDQLVITDRVGTVLFGGPVYVETIATASGSGSAPHHLRAALRSHL